MRTAEALIVWKVDVRRQLLYIKGAVPGRAGSTLHLYDAPKRPFSVTHPGAAPPFPTYTLSEADKEADAKWAAGAWGAASGCAVSGRLLQPRWTRRDASTRRQPGTSPIGCSGHARNRGSLLLVGSSTPPPSPPSLRSHAGAYMTPEEELLVDAASLGVGPIIASELPAAATMSAAGRLAVATRPAATPLAAQRVGHLVSNVAPDTEALIKAARRAGVALDADTSAVPAAVLAALAAKERAPPCEWLMRPPAVDPFSIPEADEPED